MPRIIPCLDVKQGRTVKGVNFKNLIDAGDPVELARSYDEQGADEIVFLDISATLEAREAMLSIVQAVAEQVFIPLTVGGGVRTEADVQNLLSAGADKVSINSSALANPQLISDAAMSFGSQCITIAIDAGRDSDNHASGFSVYSHGGSKHSGRDALEWVKEAEERGAGEILATSMDCDGKKTGFDLALLTMIAKAVSIPIIASGGAGEMEHFSQALKIPNVTGVLAASLFHYGELAIPQLKAYLQEQGMPMRITEEATRQNSVVK